MDTCSPEDRHIFWSNKFFTLASNPLKILALLKGIPHSQRVSQSTADMGKPVATRLDVSSENNWCFVDVQLLEENFMIVLGCEPSWARPPKA